MDERACVGAFRGPANIPRRHDAAWRSGSSHEIEERTNSRTRQQELLRRLDNDAWVVIPYYSTRMPAGLEVGERLRRLGWTLNETSSNRRPDAAGLYRLTLNGPRGQRVSASGETWELALARAALKAVAM